MDTYQNERKIDPFFEDAINQVFFHPQKQIFINEGSVGLGKALANSENVLTPTGYKSMGELRLNNYVIGSTGKPVRITGVHPQGMKDIYTVTFKDGETVRCTEDHLWTIKYYTAKKWKTVPLSWLIENSWYKNKTRLKKDGTPERQNLYCVPSVNEVTFKKQKSPLLDPYLLGLLLGDGGFTHNAVSFTNNDVDIVNKLETLLPDGVKTVRHWYNNAWHCGLSGTERCINPLNKIIRKLGLWGKYSHEKYIPDEYKYGSIEVRKKVLQGLIDTDGHVLKNGNIEFSTSSKQLMDDYCFISNSLGIRLGRVISKIPTYSYKGKSQSGRKSYRVTQLQRPETLQRIVNIELNQIKESATCITVDAEDGLFVTNGFKLTHNSSNFLMHGAYQLAQHVKPQKVGNKIVRESFWCGVRESEKSAELTFLELLEKGVFSPEIMAMKESPVTVNGSHPSIIRVHHLLEDGSYLDMNIECHGFNNDKAFNRLKTREYMMGLIPEMQAIPWIIIRTVAERCRWRIETNQISKVINGKKYTLSGVKGLGAVLCDINIPARPHPLYENCYDNPDIDNSVYQMITLPSPLLKRRVKDLPKDKYQLLKDKYPITKYEGHETMWFPNPKCYGMTKHYEEKDEQGNNIPWSGYHVWYRELDRPDSEVRRYVEGLPDELGGVSSVYMNFKKNNSYIKKLSLDSSLPVYIGFDPGKYGAFLFCQFDIDEGHVHYFHEIVFEPADGVKTRQQLENFVIPYIERHLSDYVIKFVPDPQAHVDTSHAESPVQVINELGYVVERCRVANQNTDARINSLGFFIDKQQCTVDPSCKMLIKALIGGYQYHQLRSGVISDKINKTNPFSHSAEAAQYPAVNFLYELRKHERKSNRRRTVSVIKHVRK